MVAEILAVGTELLMGQISNTDAQYLSRRLNEVGIGVFYHSVVGDNPRRLKESLKLALSRADIVITTGGLGPTEDDLTKETIAEAMGRKLVVHDETYRAIAQFFEKQNRKMMENNAKQAYLPENSMIIPNHNGTAPGCIIENGGQIVVMLPGPPKEMIPMFEETVFPYLEKKTGQTIYSRMLKIFGIGESEMETRIMDIIDAQTNPTIAPYVGAGEVVIRVSARCRNKNEADELIDPVVQKIKDRLGSHLFAINGETMEEVAVALLKEKEITISVAESCTGGMLASRLVNVPGVSEIFERGFVTYSNKSKIEELSVSKDTLDSFGAVSKETALEMVRGLVRRTGTRAGISITGIAGPGGETDNKPAGLVYIAISLDRNEMCREFKFIGDRERVRTMSCLNALNMLRKMILGL
ncbi:MAG TPA: competence/damage-inducible protein A [Ruminiclostridium sp.]|nr:competence/damage-inducible protein A [Ruminiclostridium sp.]